MNFIGCVPTVHNTLFLSLKIPESFSPPMFFFFLDVGIVTSIGTPRVSGCLNELLICVQWNLFVPNPKEINN